MNNNIIYSENLRTFKCLFWQGQPVYKQYPKLKNFIKQHLGEDVASILAEPQIPEDYDKTNIKSTWTSDTLSEAAVPYTTLSEAQKAAIDKDIQLKISVLTDLIQSMLESENAEDNKWGQLLSKATEIPDKRFMLVEGNQFTFVAWGFETPATGASKYSIKRDFYRPGQKLREKPKPVVHENIQPVPLPVEEPAEPTPATYSTQSTNNETAAPVVTPPTVSPPREIEAVTQDENKIKKEQGGGGGADDGKDKTTKKGWFGKYWWLLLLLLLLLLGLLLRQCGFFGGGGNKYLPAQPGKVVPIDSTKIVNDPDSIKKIVSDRLNIALTGTNKDINAFAKKFKDVYPGSQYEIIYYDTATHRLQIQVPVTEREKIKTEIKGKMPDFE
ncbi:MAG TPA: hypothetical protein VKH37_10310, partial [Ferruginibacter sp.]|nr:hypothetical protein [Ferruginibacter sp.]